MTGPVHGRIRDRRQRLDMPLTKFAKLVDVHISLACHWERGRARPPLAKLPVIAQTLDCSERWLVQGEDAYAQYAKALRRAA